MAQLKLYVSLLCPIQHPYIFSITPVFISVPVSVPTPIDSNLFIPHTVRMVYDLSLSAAVINESKMDITAAVCHVLCSTHLRTSLQHYVQLFAAMSRWQHCLVFHVFC